MMILHLVKKDFLIVKKYVMLMMLLAIAVPTFVGLRLPTIGGFIVFIYTVTFTELIICQSVSLEEAKFPKAAALLCAAPYPRSAFVIAKYLFFLMIFAYCYATYGVMSLIFSFIPSINFKPALLVLLFAILIYGVYLPLSFKYGFEKMKFFFMIFIFLISFGVPMLSNFFKNIKIDLTFFESIPTPVQSFILILAILAILFISIMASIKIYSKKEL